MPRLVFLVSSARETALADGSPHVTGFLAEEALIPSPPNRDFGAYVPRNAYSGTQYACTTWRERW